MKIYFSASLRGKREYHENYKMIASLICELGEELLVNTADLSDAESVSKESSIQAQDWYIKMLKWIDGSDLTLFEVSYPSLGIGHEIGTSLSRGKQVIALHVKGAKPYILDSIPNEKIQVVEYNFVNIKNKLSDAFEYAKNNLNTRFTLNLPANMIGHLNKVSENGMSKSDYIRNLIIDDINRGEK